jgi:hypothetical protein
MELLSMYANGNKKAKVFHLAKATYEVELYENNRLLSRVTAGSSNSAELIAEDFVMPNGYESPTGSSGATLLNE